MHIAVHEMKVIFASLMTVESFDSYFDFNKHLFNDYKLLRMD